MHAIKRFKRQARNKCEKVLFIISRLGSAVRYKNQLRHPRSVLSRFYALQQPLVTKCPFQFEQILEQLKQQLRQSSILVHPRECHWRTVMRTFTNRFVYQKYMIHQSLNDGLPLMTNGFFYFYSESNKETIDFLIDFATLGSVCIIRTAYGK